jgi:excisionase family DNA binding protein
MSKPAVVYEKDWYIKLAGKRERGTPVLNDLAETRLRDLDIQIAEAKEQKRLRMVEKRSRPVDIGERFTVGEIALRLKVSVSTVYEWIDNGTIVAEGHGPTGRLKRISQQALEDYLRKR